MKRKVVKITQSPLNPKRWSLDLECGHEQWVTSHRRPTRQTARCLECVELVRRKEETKP